MIRARTAGVLALAVICLAPSAPRADAPPTPARLAYQVYFGGLKAVALDADIGLSAQQYDVSLRVHTEGLIDWLLEWTARSASKGQVVDGALQPARHTAVSTVRGDRRATELTFHPDGTIDAVVDPPNDTDEREPVSPAEMRGALDPITAVLMAAHQVGASGSCAQRVPVFDGRRRYDLAFVDGGPATLKPSEYSSFSGAATLCLFRYIRIAGYQKPGGRWGNPRDYDREYRVWLASIVPGLPPLPVRIEVEGTFGELIVHLVGAQKPAG